jgi:ABC-2 type transport system ATP-binding protein
MFLSIFEATVNRIYVNRFTLHLNMVFSLDVGVTQLSGENGCGKTSLLKAMVGQYDFSGDFLIHGKSLNKNPVAYKLQCGYCPDSIEFPQCVTVIEYFRFVSDAFNKKYDRSTEDNCLAIGLHPYINKKISDLSYGNRKKVLLVASIIAQPALWIMDEPLNGLDERGLSWLEERVAMQMPNTAIFIVCHDQSWVDQFNPRRIDVV